MKEYSVSEFVKLAIIVLFILLSIDIIISGNSPNANIILGFPYYMISDGKYLLAFERAPVSSRLTIIIIILVIIDYIISKKIQIIKKNN